MSRSRPRAIGWILFGFLLRDLCAEVVDAVLGQKQAPTVGGNPPPRPARVVRVLRLGPLGENAPLRN